MTILVGSLTPFTIWRVEGGLVGACRTVKDAKGVMRDLKSDFPSNEYVCKDPDGDVMCITTEPTTMDSSED